MRILYLVLGLLIGLYFTTKIGLNALEWRDWQYERDITAYTLTGMSEGWERGRYHTVQKIYWLVMDCQEELFMYKQREVNKRGQ